MERSIEKQTEKFNQKIYDFFQNHPVTEEAIKFLNEKSSIRVTPEEVADAISLKPQSGLKRVVILSYLLYWFKNKLVIVDKKGEEVLSDMNQFDMEIIIGLLTGFGLEFSIKEIQP